MSGVSHTFAVSAYKDSPYLVDCLRSLTEQTLPSNILVATSTPSEYIAKTAAQFNIPVYIGTHKSGIGRDWNYAYSLADTDFVTIAHQDDIYTAAYTEAVMQRANKVHNPILIYTDYAQLRDGEEVTHNTLLRIKRLLNAPLIPPLLQRSKFVRRRIFSIGCPISTPSVCYNKKRFPDLHFDERMGANIDWDMWQRLSEEDGSFVYIPRRLIRHRVHVQSQTSLWIERGGRRAEDYEMFRRYWPEFIAKPLAKVYARAENLNPKA